MVLPGTPKVCMGLFLNTTAIIIHLFCYFGNIKFLRIKSNLGKHFWVVDDC